MYQMCSTDTIRTKKEYRSCSENVLMILQILRKAINNARTRTKKSLKEFNSFPQLTSGKLAKMRTEYHV